MNYKWALVLAVFLFFAFGKVSAVPSFPVSSAGHIDINNNYIFVTQSDGNWTNLIYKYYLNGTYAGYLNISSTLIGDTITGIMQNNSYIWVIWVDSVYMGTGVSRFFMNGSVSLANYGTSWGNGHGIAKNDSRFFLCQPSFDQLRTYDLNWSSDGLPALSVCDSPDSISILNNYLYVHCGNDYKISRYTFNGSYVDDFMTSINGSVISIALNSTTLLMMNAADNRIYLYDLLPHYPHNGTTYYNQFIFNNISDNLTTTGNSCWIVLNNGDKNAISCNNTNSSILANLGANNLTFFWENASGNYSDEALFNVLVACNSEHLNDKICTGEGLKYVVTCIQLGLSLYQFDYSNMTYCPDGCIDGQCLNNAYCLDRCTSGEKTCNNGYLIPCVLQSNGCFDWDAIQTDWQYCQKGCEKNYCVGCIDECQYSSSKCMETSVVYCDDDNNDGCYEWSAINKTSCQYGCYDVPTNATILNATCNVHSFGDIHDVANAIQGYGEVVNTGFDTTFLKFCLITVCCLAIGGFVGIKTSKTSPEHGWQAGLAIMGIIMFIAAWYEFYPWIVTILFLLFVGGMIWYGKK